MSADSVVAIAWDVFKRCVLVPIERGFGYVISSKSFADRLREEVQNLENEAQRVRIWAETARNNLRNFYDCFTEWQQNANEALKEAGDLLGDFEKATKTCCYGTLPDPKCRYQFSRKAEGKIEVIKQLAQKCSGFKELNDISFSNPTPGNVTAPNSARREGKDVVQSTTAMASASSASTSNKIRDDGLFESRAAIIRDIMVALADDSNSVVGIHGMGGVGKSTLLVDAERSIREEKQKQFDLIAKADVSQNPDIRRIQGEIADALGLGDIKNKESVSGRAELLHGRLKYEEREKKKVLIILDNLWEGLDLKSVGIPCGYDNKVQGCKLLLTSRERNVLQSKMGCDKDFLLGGLQEEEAKILYERMVGDKVHDDEFRSMVDEALRKCAGLPLLIVTMAKLFKYASSPEWRDALNQIERCTNKGISGVINEMLQLSYDHLESEEAKRLLQLCVAYGVSNPSVENLVRYGYGLGIFRKDSSMTQARDEFSTLIRTLQASSLLLDNGGAYGFKIHDLVRDFVAQFVLRDHPPLLLKNKDMLATQLQKERLKSCTAICFPHIDMKELPKELHCPDCPELRIFLLFNNNKSLEVPDSTFNSMRKLAVLNLTSIRLTHSPMPFQLLKNLHTLSLNSCSLEDVAILGELKWLQILSIVNSKIRRLPKEIGQLVELRLLDLSHCSQLEIIEPGILRSLIKLEELYMEYSFHQWSVVEQTPPTNASLIELNDLKNLYTLHISIPNPSVLPKDLNFKQLTKYRILIGYVQRWSEDKGSRTLQLELNPTSDILHEECIQSILCKTDNLFLNGIEQSICRLSLEGFPQLKHLHVEDSPSVRYILERSSVHTFKALEMLLLERLVNLEKICHNNISTTSFSTLKVVRVMSCDKMEVLFPCSLVRELPQLEEIEVCWCKLMLGIVEADDCGKFELPKLRVLKLHYLPNIKNFFTVGSALSSSTPDDQVGTQIAFFNGQQVSIPSLEFLTMEGLPNLKKIWSDDESPLEVSNLQSLEVVRCESLLKVISSRSLVKLQTLHTIAIKNCDSVQDIFDLDGPSDDESPLELSNLQSLEVVRCQPLLKVISSRSLVKLQKLHTLTIKNCHWMQDIFDLDGPSGSRNVETVSKLTTLELNNMGSLKCIWNKSPYGIVSFCNLKKLEVADCNNLGFMFFPSMVKSLAQLKELNVRNCNKMEAIIMEEGLGMETEGTLAFPMLTDLGLERLESLMCFSHRKCSREARSQYRVQSRSTVLFNREVSIPSLESLTMEGLPNLKEIWSDESPLELSNLQSLKVVLCKSLSKVISSRLLVKLHKLRTLTIKDCNLVQEIFDLDGPSASGNIETVSELTTLELNNMWNLKCIWNKSPCGISSFYNLKKLEVGSCYDLGFMFFPSMVKSLTQLRDLMVRYCDEMKTIITEEEEEEGSGREISETLAFPMLTDLRLAGLKSLNCFSCGKCSREAQSQDRVQSLSTVLFNREVAFLRLETLEINHLDNLEFMFSPSMVKSLPQLKKLKVWSCKKMEAIIMEEEGLGMETTRTLTFPMLTDLSLTYLESLTCFSRIKCYREAQSQNRIKSRSTALFNREVVFPRLETLEITGLDNIMMIWDDQVAADSFPKLKSLCVDECNRLVNIVTSSILGWILSLESLKAESCGSLKAVFKFQPLNPLDGHPIARSPLKELKLFDLPELKCVWDKELHCQVKFQCLRSVSVDRCESLTSLFPASIARDLMQFEELKIKRCGIVELIEKEGSEELSINVEAIEGASHELSYFRHLKTLDVSYCDGLSYMFTPTMATNLVALTKLRISNCRMFTEVISDEGGRDGHVVAFNQLKYMELEGLTRLRCFSSGGFTLMFPLLEDVTVTRCLNMNFFSKGPIETPKLKRVFFYKGPIETPKLKRAQVSGDAAAAWFWKEDLNITIQNMFEEMGMLARVKKMLLSELPDLIGKWHSELNPIKSSWQLESLTVDKFPSFIKAIPSKLMLVLDNLSFLQVCDCKSLEEIFDLEGLEAMESTKVLPHLRELKLVNLPKLRQLWKKDLQGSMCFYSLRYLTLYNCSNLGQAFTPSMVRCLGYLQRIEIKECGQMDGVVADEEGQGSAMEKITLWNLKTLKLECIPNLTSFLLGKNHTLECPKLRELTIAHCPKMRSLTWQSLMEIDHGTPLLFTPQAQFPQLWSMVLSHMDNLSKIWTDSPQETLTFEYLWRVEAQNCNKLQNLFPHWVATSLTRLKNLRVECCAIKEIVTSRDDTPHSNAALVLFPELTSLVLHDMPRLKSFCPNLPIFNWPFLEELRVTHCYKLNILSFAASMNKWTQRDDQQSLSDQEAHSSIERDFPNLKRLLLVDKDVQMIRDGKFPDDIFGKPKALTLACFHDEEVIFPLKFLQERFQNLQSLEVFCSSFEDIFPNEGLVDEGKHPVLENLRELKLNKLHNLKRVWREDYLMAKILRGIKTFEIWDCPCLTTIFLAGTSFWNLTTLVVKNSSRLVHLVTVSAVTNLLHLTRMTIIGCERMKEVVANDGNGEGNVISLRNLRRLTLQNLPSLECFSSTTSCIFTFPSLLHIEVEECPQMKIFSKCTLSTPPLIYVSLFGHKWLRNWEGRDLNTTIQKLSA